MPSLDDSKEQLLKKLRNAQGVPQTIQMAIAFLDYKLQEELLQKQNEYNDKQLFWSRALAVGTWALVLATLFLVKFS